MSTAAGSFVYEVEDINNAMRKTNTLLRAANAVRLSWRDITQLGDDPSFARLFWTLIQLSRTYTALRRLYRLVVAEMSVSASVMGIVLKITEPPEMMVEPVIPQLDLTGLSVRVDAFRENLPMGLEGLDLSNLSEESRVMLQAIMEEDAEQTVIDAKQILNERMAAYVSPWIVRPTSGFLESSIHWQSQIDGVRIVADAPYAWWVEEGQRTFLGYHYLETALQWARLRLPEKIRLELNGLLFNETT